MTSASSAPASGTLLPVEPYDPYYKYNPQSPPYDQYYSYNPQSPFNQSPFNQQMPYYANIFFSSKAYPGFFLREILVFFFFQFRLL